MKKLSILAISFCLSQALFAQSDFCKKINKKFTSYKWGDSQCEKYDFKEFGKTVNDEPLMYTVINPEKSESILVLCGVHGDEITPVKFCFDVLTEFSKVTDKKVIVVPVVSPDSFFTKVKRTNANGVDVNRNFPTKDWSQVALKQWESKYNKDKRRYPGSAPASENETKFQMYLIEEFKPSKIFSVHAPLQVFDYDGPTIKHDGSIHEAKKLLEKMSQESKNYRTGKLNVYPGSLGNWAGKERSIPTYTLELPSSNPAKHKEYWDLFKPALELAFIKK